MSNWKPSAGQMKAMGLTGLGAFVRLDKHTERVGIRISPGQVLINGETIHESGKRVTLRNGFVDYENTDLTHAEVDELLKPLIADVKIPDWFWKSAEDRFPVTRPFIRNFGCMVKPIDIPAGAKLREELNGYRYVRPRHSRELSTADGIALDAVAQRLTQSLNGGSLDRAPGESDFGYRLRVTRKLAQLCHAVEKPRIAQADTKPLEYWQQRNHAS